MSGLTKKEYLEKKYKEFTKELSTELCDNIFHLMFLIYYPFVCRSMNIFDCNIAYFGQQI